MSVRGTSPFRPQLRNIGVTHSSSSSMSKSSLASHVTTQVAGGGKTKEEVRGHERFRLDVISNSPQPKDIKALKSVNQQLLAMPSNTTMIATLKGNHGIERRTPEQIGQELEVFQNKLLNAELKLDQKKSELKAKVDVIADKRELALLKKEEGTRATNELKGINTAIFKGESEIALKEKELPKTIETLNEGAVKLDAAARRLDVEASNLSGQETRAKIELDNIIKKGPAVGKRGGVTESAQKNFDNAVKTQQKIAKNYALDSSKKTELAAQKRTEAAGKREQAAALPASVRDFKEAKLAEIATLRDRIPTLTAQRDAAVSIATETGREVVGLDKGVVTLKSYISVLEDLIGSFSEEISRLPSVAEQLTRAGAPAPQRALMTVEVGTPRTSPGLGGLPDGASMHVDGTPATMTGGKPVSDFVDDNGRILWQAVSVDSAVTGASGLEAIVTIEKGSDAETTALTISNKLIGQMREGKVNGDNHRLMADVAQVATLLIKSGNIDQAAVLLNAKPTDHNFGTKSFATHIASHQEPRTALQGARTQLFVVGISLGLALNTAANASGDTSTMGALKDATSKVAQMCDDVFVHFGGVATAAYNGELKAGEEPGGLREGGVAQSGNQDLIKVFLRQKIGPSSSPVMSRSAPLPVIDHVDVAPSGAPAARTAPLFSGTGDPPEIIDTPPPKPSRPQPSSMGPVALAVIAALPRQAPASAVVGREVLTPTRMLRSMSSPAIMMPPAPKPLDREVVTDSPVGLPTEPPKAEASVSVEAVSGESKPAPITFSTKTAISMAVDVRRVFDRGGKDNSANMALKSHKFMENMNEMLKVMKQDLPGGEDNDNFKDLEARLDGFSTAVTTGDPMKIQDEAKGFLLQINELANTNVKHVDTNDGTVWDNSLVQTPVNSNITLREPDDNSHASISTGMVYQVLMNVGTSVVDMPAATLPPEIHTVSATSVAAVSGESKPTLISFSTQMTVRHAMDVRKVLDGGDAKAVDKLNSPRFVKDLGKMLELVKQELPGNVVAYRELTAALDGIKTGIETGQPMVTAEAARTFLTQINELMNTSEVGVSHNDGKVLERGASSFNLEGKELGVRPEESSRDQIESGVVFRALWNAAAPAATLPPEIHTEAATSVAAVSGESKPAPITFSTRTAVKLALDVRRVLDGDSRAEANLGKSAFADELGKMLNLVKQDLPGDVDAHKDLTTSLEGFKTGISTGEPLVAAEAARAFLSRVNELMDTNEKGVNLNDGVVLGGSALKSDFVGTGLAPRADGSSRDQIEAGVVHRVLFNVATPISAPPPPPPADTPAQVTSAPIQMAPPPAQTVPLHNLSTLSKQAMPEDDHLPLFTQNLVKSVMQNIAKMGSISIDPEIRQASISLAKTLTEIKFEVMKDMGIPTHTDSDDLFKKLSAQSLDRLSQMAMNPGGPKLSDSQSKAMSTLFDAGQQVTGQMTDQISSNPRQTVDPPTSQPVLVSSELHSGVEGASPQEVAGLEVSSGVQRAAFPQVQTNPDRESLRNPND